LPEYYLTRAETEILKEHSKDICSLTGPVTLIELGSGTSVKTDYLLSAYANSRDRVRYVPVDVSEPSIQVAEENIRSRHPTVDVEGIVGTYESAFPKFDEHSPSMVLFLGSTIGNLEPDETEQFWRQIEESLSPGDCFLLGADLVKDVSVLEAAYNDSQGVTAEFMKNVFARMNRELGSDVDVGGIDHIAEYCTVAQQVEHFARFSSDQEVFIEPLESTVQIDAGESVLLEISRKFVLKDLVDYVDGFGFDTVSAFTDSEGRFADLLMRKR
jgi:L-histidine N-alpha-methyltransferase